MTLLFSLCCNSGKIRRITLDCIGGIIGTDRSAMCVEGKTPCIRDTSTVKYSFYYIPLFVVSGDCIHYVGHIV